MQCFRRTDPVPEEKKNGFTGSTLEDMSMKKQEYSEESERGSVLWNGTLQITLMIVTGPPRRVLSCAMF